MIPPGIIDGAFRLGNWFHHQSSGKWGKKRRKDVNFLKKTLYFVSWNGCSNRVDKHLILVVREDFLPIRCYNSVAISKNHQESAKRPKNVIFYTCRMTHRLDMGHPSFCLWNVIFTEDSMQIIHMVG